MSTPYTVEPGDCLSSIAAAFNFDDWKTIYYYAENADFRQLRPDPNVIYPGDLLYIPDFDAGQQNASTETNNLFTLNVVPTLLRLKIMSVGDQPVAGAKYKLEIPGLPNLEGSTGGDGMISEAIPPDTTTGLLTVFKNGASAPPIIWRLQVGDLNPVTEVSGQQARLNNLGFDAGDVNGLPNSVTDAAVSRFQDKNGLVVDGKCGPITQGKLKSLFGA